MQAWLQNSVIATEEAAFPSGSFITIGRKNWLRLQRKRSERSRTSFSKANRPSHHVPRSHRFQTYFSQSTKRQRSRPSVRTANDRPLIKFVAQSRRIPKWLTSVKRVWPSASNPHPITIASTRSPNDDDGLTDYKHKAHKEVALYFFWSWLDLQASASWNQAGTSIDSGYRVASH